MTRLTSAEESVMQIIWKLEKAFVKEIIAEMEEPRPPYNTISSVVRVLEKKGFVDYEAFGKTHQYFPIITKNAYRRKIFKNFMTDYFDNSHKKLVQFFASEEDLDVNELKSMLSELKENEK